MLPRYERDPRVELVEPDASSRPLSPLRAPLWIAIDTSFVRRDPGDTSFGAMLLLGLPLDRLFARDVRVSSIGDRPSPADHGDPPRADPPPALKPPPRAKPEPAPAPPKVPPVPPTATPPLRIPIVVPPEAARAAVEAALRKARLSDPDARLDAMASRARAAAALPELRLRVLRSVDQGQTLSPTEYDANRTTASGGSSFWMEARATWRLDRLVFAEEEVSFERMRHERAEARAKVTARVLKLLFEWQRALALADNPAASPEENLAARLHALEAEAELDLLTDGWLTRFQGGPAKAR
ncbi:Hypothetical protein A7982_11389 [Minicystis rosea]|nr:Hypothetical protein A7982_11389 [Minicystis rosea]